MRPLLAKTPKDRTAPQEGETLPGHSLMVGEAVRTVLDAVGEDLVRSMARPEARLFFCLSIIGAWLHDIGKAGDYFQRMLYSDPGAVGTPHPIRHEVLGALLVTDEDSPLREWLASLDTGYGELFPWLLSWVIGGHHLRLHKPRTGAARLMRLTGESSLVFQGAHPDMAAMGHLIAKHAGFEQSPPRLSDVAFHLDLLEGGERELEQAVTAYIRQSERLSTRLSPGERRALALAKAVVVSADVAGSALAADGRPTRDWIQEALANVLTPHDLDRVIASRLDSGCLRPFQLEIGASGAPVTLTVAGCGNGKTLAAYVWGKRHAQGRKLFFCYPTTGTATAGFEDYLHAQKDLERDLIHGRSQVDMERLLGSNEDGLVENQRLESIQAWTRQVVACTTDVVLGLVQNQRRPLFLFPAIAKGAFVFDEIHSYDARLFGALLRFLTTFPDNPALLMSASLPPKRLTALERALGKRLSGVIGGDSTLEGLPRYSLHWRRTPEDCWPAVEEALARGEKVLWVCNTVSDACCVLDAAARRSPIRPILYHSRFRYRNRIERQAEVIAAFRNSGPCLVISTQVCEMSLDISADLMVSALAPFHALIQRLGRLNRRASPLATPIIRPCLIHNFACAEGRPYRKQELHASRTLVEANLDRPLSQTDLAGLLAGCTNEDVLSGFSAWLDGGWESDRRPLREDGAAINVLLREDLEEIHGALRGRGRKATPRSVAEWVVPLLYNASAISCGELGGYPVFGAEWVKYDQVKGASWARKMPSRL
ncbi:CRISPR-associated helicase Cas3' [Desulfocurvibacter africanus]|uniref:CRISPR-associated helicase Cas3' n=1 Tax=Desulfocurvibacter africanus TaxID=873 RepID=UPI002FD95617